MPGFFPEVPQKRVELFLLPRCGLCNLYKTCRTPKMPVAGKGREGILIIGDAPGKDEDRAGEPFVGASGRRLRQAVTQAGRDTFRDCWLYNALICHPKTTPKDKAVDWCRPNVITQIEELKPKVILLLGGRAVQSVIGWLWKEDVGSVSQWAGFRAPSQQLNAWVCVAHNPAYVLRQEHPVEDMRFDDHVRKAVIKTERPWKAVPDWKKGLDCEQNPTIAAQKIRTKFGSKPIAFDFETTALKPDNPLAQVYCCSISDGTYTIAFPWIGDAIEATKRLLISAVPKIGYNIKFEDRWARDKLGIQIQNWKHCGMQIAHLLDHRNGITSLKFQAFVRLGVGDYDSHIKPYLKSDDGGNGLNRIKELPLHQVLEYCAMDSLLEFKVAQHQFRELGR